MDELIVASLQGRTTPEEEETLRAWRDDSSENEERYQALQRVWEATDIPLPAARRPRPTSASVILAASQHRAASRRSESPTWKVWTSRAAAVGALAASFVVGLFASGSFEGGPGLAAGELHTGSGPGAAATLSLEDGSVIRVAPESTVRLERVADERVVWLDGRAFFSVAEQKGRPFSIRTPNGEVVVRGTRFQVDSQQRRFEVVVVEGRVDVSAGADRREVAKGQIATAENGSRLSVRATDRLQDRLAWIGRFMVFHDTPLGDALDEIEARFGVPIQVVDSAPLTRTITVTFDDEPFGSAVDVICRATGASCAISDTLVVVRGAR